MKKILWNHSRVVVLVHFPFWFWILELAWSVFQDHSGMLRLLCRVGGGVEFRPNCAVPSQLSRILLPRPCYFQAPCPPSPFPPRACTVACRGRFFGTLAGTSHDSSLAFMYVSAVPVSCSLLFLSTFFFFFLLSFFFFSFWPACASPP